MIMKIVVCMSNAKVLINAGKFKNIKLLGSEIEPEVVATI